MFNLDDETINDVIRLSENYHLMGEFREAYRTVKGIEAWWGKPDPERAALEKLIRSRPRLEQYDLVVLYWAGERGGPPEDWEAAVDEAMATIADPADYLAGKAHLGEYLRGEWRV